MLYPDALWSGNPDGNRVYLTFDDGPVSQVTPWVLDVLRDYDIRATFFCVGENIIRHTKIFDRLIAEGHLVGNHSYNHLKGWKTANEIYFENIARCEELTQTGLFRPPYGKMRLSQYNSLKTRFKIIMWDVLSYDFEKRLQPEKCLQNVVRNTKAGSIVLFHDHEKAFTNLKYALPRAIENLTNRNFIFDTL